MKIGPTVGVLLHSRRARGAVVKFLSPRIVVTKRTVYKLVAFAGIVLFGFWLDWAGYGRILRYITNTAVPVSVVQGLYAYAMANLEEAKKHNDELR